MKCTLLLLFIFFAATTFSQKSEKAYRISIGYSFSPDYNFRMLKNSDGSNSSDLVINIRDGMEKGKIGYTTGFNVTFKVSAVLAFETGLQYSNKGYKTKEQHLIFLPPNPDPNVPDRVTTTYSYQYIGSPLIARFTFGKRLLRFVSSAGFMTNFLINVKQSMKYKYADGKTEKKNQSSTSGFNKVDLSPMVSVGVVYKLTDKMNLSAEPTFRFGLIKSYDGPIRESLWNAGLVAGVSYNLQ